MKKKLIFVVMTLIILLVFASCKQLDVIGNTSVSSFNEVLKALPDPVLSDDMNGGWSLSAPDGSARFIWSKDFTRSPAHDVMIETEAQPFINAGLDVNKLPAGMLIDGKIMVGTKLGNKAPVYKGDVTPIASYENIVNQKRDAIKYHTALDHFGIDLGNGNVFEWAKDISKNDKDMVFALDPQVFINAGVNPQKVEGWLFAKIKSMDASGRPIEVDKFLKPFNLK